jgi:hypothetical protein
MLIAIWLYAGSGIDTYLSQKCEKTNHDPPDLLGHPSQYQRSFQALFMKSGIIEAGEKNGTGLYLF